jgi:hypothetical protein
MSKRKDADEKWETPSLEWIHRVRAEMVKRGERGPMPLARQKALAAKFGLKLVGPREKAAAK